MPATEGIGGLTPQLSIRHAGADARGILGTGMTVAGLSSIAPCRRTIAQDGAAGPIQLQSADKYCMDGARLRLVSGTYGASGAVYQTELEQYRADHIVRFGQRPARLVQGRDARRADPRVRSLERLGVARRDAAQLTDPAVGGEQHSRSQRQRDRVSLPERPGDPGVSPRFHPLHRQRARGHGPLHDSLHLPGRDPAGPRVHATRPSGAGGASRIETGLLDRIELRHDEATYRQLLFTYETGAGSNTRLHTVQTCAASSSDCFPATTFTWQSATAGHAAPSGSAAVDAWTSAARRERRRLGGPRLGERHLVVHARRRKRLWRRHQ